MASPKDPRKRSKLQKLLGSIVPGVTKPFVHAADRTLRNADVSLRRELERRATGESADIVTGEMPEALYCGDRFGNLEYSLSFRQPGLILEFGVAGGKTINHIANLCPEDRVFGFDSFQGLPEHWAGNRFSRRNFTQHGVLPKVPAHVELIPGWFNETLPKFLEAHPEPVGFLHVDCDIYSSTKYVLDTLKDRLPPKSVIVFDEFFNYPGFRQHEYRAFHEFIAETGKRHRFVSFAGNQATAVLD
jgi:predicted O-methyltransferase YrrM